MTLVAPGPTCVVGKTKMNFNRWALLLVVGLATMVRAAPARAAAQEPRIWTSRRAQHRTEATWVEFVEDSVRLQKPNGEMILVAIDRLSEPDRAYLRRRAQHASATRATHDCLFSGPGEGLQAEYFADASFDELGQLRTDPAIDLVFDQRTLPYKGGKPLKNLRDGWPENFVARWTGLVVPEFSETYTFFLQADDSGVLWVNDKLLVNAWSPPNSKEHSATIDLTAGQPVPIKVLYFNWGYAGSAKLSWSSPSQPRQVVPQERLFLPFAESEASSVPMPDLAQRLSLHRLALGKKITNNPRGLKPSLILAADANGECRLGWNDQAKTLHVTRLSSDFQVLGKDVTVAGVDLRGLTLEPDGGVGLMLAQLPNRMWAMKLDDRGRLVYRTLLMGGKGRGANQHFLDDNFSFAGRCASSGAQFAVHFAHSWNTGQSGVHQGGYYGLLDRQGKVVSQEQWTVSHSLDQRLIFHEDCFLSCSAGDCYPKGISFHNRTLNLGRVIYPDIPSREAFGNCAGTVNAVLGSMIPVGRDVGLTFLTRIAGSQEVIYLLVSGDGTAL